MKKNRVFILCDTTSKKWQLPCANAERHVESRQFAVSVEKAWDTLLSAASPRRLFDGTETENEKFKKLKKALKDCRYVYAIDGWEKDPMCVRLERVARWRFKTFIKDEEE